LLIVGRTVKSARPFTLYVELRESLKVLTVPVPQLSIIIPTLNEAEHLPSLLHDLAAQEGISFEVIISDGGSEDLTCQFAIDFLTDKKISCKILNGPPGRGRQMNLASAAARGAWILFLHADSRLYDKALLRDGLTLLEQACAQEENCRVAGHFSLNFDLPQKQKTLGLYFSEAKARLHEAGCTHGDQGFLLASEFFKEVGPFREDLPVMEDAWLAETIRRKGHWLLLPLDIHTSARRFQVEGLAERQTLNALLMNFLFIGWDDFLQKAPAIYRQQRDAGQIQLHPFRREIKRMLRKLPLTQRCKLWYATGCYIRSQAWQLIFYRQVRRHFRSGEPASKVPDVSQQSFRKWFDLLTDNFLGSTLAAVLTWLWFSLSFGRGPAKGE
jgi:rSAM/selenodomain-associated transferase 2